MNAEFASEAIVFFEHEGRDSPQAQAAAEVLSVLAQYFSDVQGIVSGEKPYFTKAKKVSDSPERWEFEFPFVPASYNELRGMLLKAHSDVERCMGSFWRYVLGKAMLAAGRRPNFLSEATVFFRFGYSSSGSRHTANFGYAVREILRALTSFGVLGGGEDVMIVVAASRADRDFTEVTVFEGIPSAEEIKAFLGRPGAPAAEQAV